MTSRKEPPELGDDNWITWYAAIEGFYYLQELETYLEAPPPVDEEKKDAATLKQRADYAKGSKKAHAVMKMYLTEKYINMTEHCKSAYEIITLLKEHFIASAKNKVPINIEKLVQLAKNTPAVEDLALKIRSIAANIGEVKVNTDQFMVPYFAALIPPELADLRIAMKNTTAAQPLSITNAAELVKNEMKRRNIKPTIAAQVKPKQDRGEREERSARKLCTHCGRRNHVVENCYFKNRNEKSSEKSKLKLSAIQQRTCAMVDGRHENKWYLDSGAHSHSVNDENGFESLSKSHNIELESAGGDTIKVEGVGVYNVQADTDVTFKLQNCIYYPQLIAKFSSAGKLNDHGMDIWLKASGECQILENGKIMATGQKRNGLYELNLQTKSVDNRTLAAIKGNPTTLMEWHRRLGHLNYTDLMRLADKIDLKKCDEPFECKVCLLAKMTRRPFKKSKIKTTAPLQIVHTDLSGIIRAPAVGNVKYFLTFIDDYSRFVTVYLLKSKDEVFEKFTEYKALVENQLDRKIKKLRSDNGTEYKNHRFDQLMKESGIDHHTTQTDTSQQNGVSERMNRTIANGARNVLLDSNIPDRFWPYAVIYTVQVRNKSPSAPINFKTPHELWYGQPTEYRQIHRFGCHAVAKVMNPDGKFANRGIECRLLCECSDKKGFVLLDPESNRIFESRDVFFLAEEDPIDLNERRKEITFEMVDEDDGENACEGMCFDLSERPEEQPAAQPAANDETINNLLEVPEEDDTLPNVLTANEIEISTADDQAQSQEVEPLATTISNEERSPIVPDQGIIKTFTRAQLENYAIRHPQANIRALRGAPTKVQGEKGRPAIAHRYRITFIHPNKIISDALAGDDGAKGKEAMDNEYQALMRNGTWTLTEAPKNAKIIKTKWILTKKPDGESVKCKARLVAKGFDQRDGIDYDETYAPVLRSSSIKVLLSHALKNDLQIHHVDVKNAYLNAPLENDIYVEQPFGYEKRSGDRLVCKLNKAMYGLKQAAKCWNDFLTGLMNKLGLRQFASDECIFSSKRNELIVGAYVDDLLVISESEQVIENFKRRLAELILITDKGKLSRFLGMDVVHTQDRIELSQASHINELLTMSEMYGSKGAETPISTGAVFQQEEEDHPFEQVKKYQSIIGSLMYIANGTRPDIQFAANKLGRYMSNPLEKHMKLARRVIRYLKKTIDTKLVFNRDGDKELIIFADADFANDESGKSVSGKSVFHGGNLIGWSSNRQQLVALPTCEAELNAIKDASTEAVYNRQLISEIQDESMELPTTIYNDNLPTIDIIAEGGKHSRTKHYKLRVQFVQELIGSEIVKVHHMNTEEMLADVLTKPLSKRQHEYLLSKAGLAIKHQN